MCWIPSLLSLSTQTLSRRQQRRVRSAQKSGNPKRPVLVPLDMMRSSVHITPWQSPWEHDWPWCPMCRLHHGLTVLLAPWHNCAPRAQVLPSATSAYL